jgi:hypothetical protein
MKFIQMKHCKIGLILVCCKDYCIEFLVENGASFKSKKGILETCKILPGFVSELDKEKLFSKDPKDVEKAKDKQMPSARFRNLVQLKY